MPGQVCVGIGVLVIDRDRDSDRNHVLLGRRKGAHGAGTWALPGGWLEKGEAFEACALRELEEETGLVAADVKGAAVLPVVANNVMDEGVHSVTVFVGLALANRAARARVCEPDKCHEWCWVPVADPVPRPTFPPLETLYASEYWRTEVATR